MDKRTFELLDEHYKACVKYWIKAEKCDEKTAMLNALEDIRNVKYNPFVAFPKEDDLLDADTVRQYKESRLMDIYGKQWEEHINEI